MLSPGGGPDDESQYQHGFEVHMMIKIVLVITSKIDESKSQEYCQGTTVSDQ